MELIPNGEDIRHWGSYDAVDHGFDARTQGPVGRAVREAAFARRGAFGTVMVPPTNPMGMLAVPGAIETRGRLQYISAAIQPAFLNALAPTEFVPTGGAMAGYQQGTIQMSLGTGGPAWYNQAVAAGSAVLVDIDSVLLPSPRFYIVSDPSYVASHARAPGGAAGSGPAAIVAIAPALEVQAQSYLPPQPQPGVPPPPQPLPGVPPAASTAPPWGAIIVGGVVLTGIGILVVRGFRG